MFGNFGDIMGMMGKIGSIKDKFSDLKNDLESEIFTTTSNDGSVKITMSKLATVKDIENWSFLMDFKIILQTVINIFKGEEKAY